jgi:hypothetical protein
LIVICGVLSSAPAGTLRWGRFFWNETHGAPQVTPEMLCTLCFLAGAITGIIIFVIVANMIVEG